MPSPSYGQVVALHKTLQETDPRYKNVTLDQYVKGKPGFEKAVSGAAIKAPARFMSRLVEETGIPSGLGDTFSTLAGKFDDPGSTRYSDMYRNVGRGIGHGIPQIAMMFGGGWGALAAGALSGGQSYEQTGNPGQATFHALSTTAFPYAAGLGGKAGVAALSRAAPKLTPRLAQDTMLNRLTNVAGSTVAGAGLNVGTDLYDRFNLGDKPGMSDGQGGDMSTMEYLAMQGVSQIPFSALDVPRLRPGFKGNFRVEDHAAMAQERVDLQTREFQAAMERQAAKEKATLDKRVASWKSQAFTVWTDPNRFLPKDEGPRLPSFPKGTTFEAPAKRPRKELVKKGGPPKSKAFTVWTQTNPTIKPAVYGIAKVEVPAEAPKAAVSKPPAAAVSKANQQAYDLAVKGNRPVLKSWGDQPEGYVESPDKKSWVKPKPGAAPVQATKGPEPKPIRIPAAKTEVAVTEQSKQASVQELRTVPAVVDGETAGSVAATVNGVAGRNKVELDNDNVRVAKIEIELQKGENMTEAIARKLNSEKMQLEHSIVAKPVPDTVTESARKMYDRFTQGMKVKEIEIDKLEATPEQKAQFKGELQNEHRILGDALLKYGDNDALVGRFADTYADWLKTKEGGHQGLGTRLTRTREVYDKQQKKLDKDYKEKTAPKSEETKRVKVQNEMDAVRELNKASEAGNKEARALMDHFLQLYTGYYKNHGDQLTGALHKFLVDDTITDLSPENFEQFAKQKVSFTDNAVPKEAGPKIPYRENGEFSQSPKNKVVLFKDKDTAEAFLATIHKENENDFRYTPVHRTGDNKWYIAKVGKTRTVGGQALDAVDAETAKGFKVAKEESGPPENYVTLQADMMYIPVSHTQDKDALARSVNAIKRAKELGLELDRPLNDLMIAANEQLRQETGFHIDPGTGRLVYEIDDSFWSTNMKGSGAKMLKDGWIIPVDEILEHTELYKAFPDLANYSVRLIKDDPTLGGYVDIRNKQIYVNAATKDGKLGRDFWEDTFQRVLLHELQHSIWSKSSLPWGANPEMFADFKQSWSQLRDVVLEASAMKDFSVKAEDIGNHLSRSVEPYKETVQALMKLPMSELDAMLSQLQRLTSYDNFDLYWATYGEVVARDTDRRYMMSAEERRSNPPLVDAAGHLPLEKMLVFQHSPNEILRAPLTTAPSPGVTTHPASLLYHKLMTEKGYSSEHAGLFAQGIDKLASVYGNLSPLVWKELKTRANSMEAGVALNIKDGPKAIALKILDTANYDPRLMFAVGTHEAGHHVTNLYAEGLLPQELAGPFANMEKVLTSMPESGRIAAIKEAYHLMMPENLKSDAVLKALTSRASEPREVIANFLAIGQTAAIIKPRTFGELISYLPVHVMNMIRSGMRAVRDMFGSVAEAGAYERNSNFSMLDVHIATDSLKGYTRELGKLISQVNKHHKVVQDFSNIYKNIPDNIRQMFAESGDILYAEQQAPDSKYIQDWMTIAPDLSVEHKDTYVNKIMLPQNIADADIHMRDLASIPVAESSYEKKISTQINMIKFAVDPDVMDTNVKIDPKNSSFAKVLNDPALVSASSDLIRYANFQRQTIFDLLVAKDKGAQELYDKIPAESKTTVLDMIARMQKLEQFAAEDFYKTMRSTREHVFGNILISRKLIDPDAQTAKAFASRLYDLSKVAAEGDPTALMTTLMSMGADAPTTEVLTRLFTSQAQHLEKMYTTMKSSPYFVSERRMKQYHVSILLKKTNETGLYDFDSADEAKQFMKAHAGNKEVEFIDKAPRDTWANAGRKVTIGDNAFSHVELEESKAVARLNEDLTSLGLAEDEVKRMAGGIQIVNALKEYESSKQYGSLNITRHFKLGRESMNMVDQQEQSIRNLGRVFGRKYSDSYIALLKKDPKVYNDGTRPMTDRLEESLVNYRVPDTETGRRFSMLGFLNFVPMNLSNIMVEQFGWLTSLAPKLTEEGAGLVGGYKLVKDALKTATDLELGAAIDPQIRQMLQDAEMSGKRGMGLLSELSDVDAMIDVNAHWYKSPLAHVTKLAARPYQAGVKLNETISLIAAWNHTKSKLYPKTEKLDKAQYAQVYQETARIASLVNNTLGRVNRPTALFGSSDPVARTTSQMLYSLQSYNFTVYSNTIRQYRKAFTSAYKNLPAAERQSAQVALGQALVTFVALAGVAGIPMLAVGDKLQEQVSGVSIRDSIAALMRDWGGENGEFLADISNHGIAHAFGVPLDISQRVAPGGLLGFNNYNGFELDKLAGPVVGMGKNWFDGMKLAISGDWTEAYKKALPPLIGQSAALLSTGGVLTDSSGAALSQSSQTWSNKLASVMGFKPREVVQNQDVAQVARRANDASTKTNKATAIQVGKALVEGDVERARTLVGAAFRQGQGLVDPLDILESGMDQAEQTLFGRDPRDMVTLGGSQDFDARQQASLPQVPSKVQKLMWRQQMRNQLGVPGYTERKFQVADAIDQLQRQQPGLSTARARAMAEAQLGGDEQDYFQLMSGATGTR